MLKKLLFLLFALSISTHPDLNAASKTARPNVFHTSFNDPNAILLKTEWANNQGDIYRNTMCSVFFDQMRQNFPLNSHGTCSFTAISMILSYYDAVISDDFIEERFDSCTQFDSAALIDEEPIIPFDCISPGVNAEPYDDVVGLSNSDYLKWCELHFDDYFQSYLITIAENMFGWNRDDLEADPFGLSFYEEVALLNYYNVYKRGLNSSCVVLKTIEQGATARDYLSFLNENLENNNPVLLNVTVNPESSDEFKHSVVAYDFRSQCSSFDDIFVHPGWLSNDPSQVLTHLPLSALSSNGSSIRVDGAIAFEPRFFDDASDNYKTESGSVCVPKNMIKPHNPRIDGPNYRDVEPIIIWDSFMNNPWEGLAYSDLRCVLMDSQKNTLDTTILNADGFRRYFLSEANWDYLMNDDVGDYYYFSVSIRSADNLSGWDETSVWILEKPAAYFGANSFSIRDAFLPSALSDSSIRRTCGESSFEMRGRYCSVSNGKLSLKSSRGYKISKLEIEFDKPILRIDFSGGLVTGQFGQRVDFKIYSSNDSTNEQFLEKDCLESIKSSQMKWESCILSHPSKKVRFDFFVYPSAPIFGANVTSAALTISRFAVWHRLPTSGFEAPYEPLVWNETDLLNNSNCYSYAVNGKDGSWLEDIGALGSRVSVSETADQAVEAFFTDFKRYFGAESGLVCLSDCIKRIGRFDVAPEGMYKIAFCWDVGLFHFYRQNPDGFWSHKNHHDQVRDVDFSGEPIIDPLFSDRGYYHDLIGYFAIKPVCGGY